jgi:hypothetical protein
MQFPSTSCYSSSFPRRANTIPPTPYSVNTKNKLGRRRPVGHIAGPRNKEDRDGHKTEKNGGIMWGRPGPWRGCSTIHGRTEPLILNHSEPSSYLNATHSLTPMQKNGAITVLYVLMFLCFDTRTAVAPNVPHHPNVGRDSSVGIWLTTGWTIQGSHPRGVRDFPHPSIPALGPTQPPTQ